MQPTPLKIELIKRDLTQREIARKVGIQESIMSLITRGRYLPTNNQKKAISEAVGVAVAVLFGGPALRRRKKSNGA